MARNLPPYEQLVEEDYIDMDVSSTTTTTTTPTRLCYPIPSPPHSREFEFQKSAGAFEVDPIPSPADELFYKGKLLPLHLPPRIQMVEKLLQSPAGGPPDGAASTAASTPFESCNISPATSCYASGELRAEDYFYECPAELAPPHHKKSWSKKLRQSSLGLKLRASKAYLKSLFTRSACSDESPAVPRAKEPSGGHLCRAGKKGPFGQIHRAASSAAKSIDGERMAEEHCGHRRSFSGAMKRRSSNKSASSASSSCSSSNSSSFSSVNSSGAYGPQVLKRSSSANSEVENSIQGAIAYCKKSQQVAGARKSVSDAGLCSLPASEIAIDCERQEEPGICRG